MEKFLIENLPMKKLNVMIKRTCSLRNKEPMEVKL